MVAAVGFHGLAAAQGLHGFAAATGLQGLVAAGLHGLVAAAGLHGLTEVTGRALAELMRSAPLVHAPRSVRLARAAPVIASVRRLTDREQGFLLRVHTRVLA